jgi:Flp pilus assembly protein TadG
LIQTTSGSSAAEFALVLPVLLIFLFGIIDGGRLLYTVNRAEKATQMAVRYAVVTDMVPSTLATRNFALNGGATGGSPVPTSLFDTTECDNTTCTNSWGYNATAFANIAQRARFFMPEATATHVKVVYTNVGLGFAGDPNGPDVAPLVTVRLTGLRFQPVLFTLFNAGVNLPDFQASLTGEDFSGTVSN